MVTLANTSNTSYNNVPTQDTLVHQGQTILYNLKQKLVAAGYVIEISSDGTTLKTDGTDQWSSSASVVFATAGSAHSYVVLKTPSGMLPSSNQARVLIDCGVGASNNHLANFGFATAAYTSSGSVNTIPTAPTNNSAFNNKQFLHSTVANSKWHCQYVTAGTEVGNFLFEISQDGTGRFHFALGVLAIHGAETGDNWPVVFICSFVETSTGAMSVGQITGSTHSAQAHYDGTMATGARFINAYSNADGTDVMASFGTAGSSITGVYPDFPLVVADTTAGKLTVRGYIVDLAWAPSAVATLSGTVEPASGSTTTTIIGTVWVPNGNVTPSL